MQASPVADCAHPHIPIINMLKLCVEAPVRFVKGAFNHRARGEDVIAVEEFSRSREGAPNDVDALTAAL